MEFPRSFLPMNLLRNRSPILVHRIPLILNHHHRQCSQRLSSPCSPPNLNHHR